MAGNIHHQIANHLNSINQDCDRFRAMQRLDELSNHNFGDYIHKIFTFLSDKHYIQLAASEIKRQLSSPSKFIVKMQKEKWDNIKSETKVEIKLLLLDMLRNCNEPDSVNASQESITIIAVMEGLRWRNCISSILAIMKRPETNIHALTASFKAIGNIAASVYGLYETVALIDWIEVFEIGLQLPFNSEKEEYFHDLYCAVMISSSELLKKLQNSSPIGKMPMKEFQLTICSKLNAFLSNEENICLERPNEDLCLATVNLMIVIINQKQKLDWRVVLENGLKTFLQLISSDVAMQTAKKAVQDFLARLDKI